LAVLLTAPECPKWYWETEDEQNREKFTKNKPTRWENARVFSVLIPIWFHVECGLSVTAFCFAI
jgi:hypothetical protein